MKRIRLPSVRVQTILPRLALALGLMGATSGCLVEETDEPEEGVIPPRVQLAFDVNCALSGCHDTSTAKAGLSLVDGESGAIIGGSSSQSELPLVELGNVDGSYLALKVLGDPSIVMDEMPQGGGGVPDDLAVIVAWIAGAEFPESGDGDGDGDITFDGDVYPILMASCSCHLSDAGVAGLSLAADSAYMNLFEVADKSALPYVTPMEVGESYLWYKITGTQAGVGEGGLMPPGSMSSLSPEQLGLIRDWIELGAPE